jgi:xanthine dehydrogenase YagR molybdenum-binding subunit
MAGTAPAAIGAPLTRVEGREKVTGAARYAAEYQADDVAHAWIVQAPVARGRITSIDTARAAAAPGVLTVLTHDNAQRLVKGDDPELYVLQEPEVHYRGQIVALVVADTLENAREAAAHVAVEVAPTPHRVVLDAADPNAYVPETANAGFPGVAEQGDPVGELTRAAVRVDHVYTTPAEHNNAMEPHASLASWDGDDLTVYDSNQGSATARDTLAKALGVEAERVRVVNRHVGGGFGSKGTPRPQLVLAAIAARAVGRPVKLAITRQQMFAFIGYRTPTVQRVALGADVDGRLVAITHDATMQSSRTREFTEQTVVATRHMYAAEHRRTRHRLVRLDVPTPSWMRAPGECPGMYALESAMDELALAAGVDPIELRIRNEPEQDPEKGIPFSSRNLVACLREGARRFGWDPATRDPTPGARRDGAWLVGTGVAASTYPAYRSPATARVTRDARGDTYNVHIAATDLGTGARTALTQIAADALEAPVDRVVLELGDSALPKAGLAGGSMGTASWGTAIVLACRDLRAKGDGATEGFGDSSEDVENQDSNFSRHAFGAQFSEVGVNPRTGEVRVRRHLGVFAAGRIINPRTARSQFLGGMTMGIGMALLEEGVMDPNMGDYVNHDLAQYHVPAHADIMNLDAAWIDEDDPHLNPMGSKGIGEIGITGAPAAVANAVHHACGVRVRDLPIRLDRILAAIA